MNITANWGTLLWWASGLSLLILLASVVALPWVVTRLPADYFNQSRRAVTRRAVTRRAAIRARNGGVAVTWLVVVAKNILGAILVLLGVLMLLTPGQGLLTLLMGLMLMNFPGKYQFERWLVRRPGVLRGLNWIRSRYRCPPFETPLR